MAIVRGYYIGTYGQLGNEPARSLDSPVSSRGKNRLHRLPSDGNIAKTENHAPARCEAAKTHLGPETRKQEHQI